MSEKFQTTDQYISTFTDEIRIKLEEMRAIICAAAPTAAETISYNMPAVFQGSVLVYYAGYKKHIGFYPSGMGIEHFKERLGDYKWSKGAIQFPLDAPLPEKLITDIVRFRITENTEKAKRKSRKSN